MTLNGRYHSVSKHMRLSDPTMKIWMKRGLHYQHRRYSAMTLASGNIKFMRIFAGVSSEVIENDNFQYFRSETLEVRLTLLYSVIKSSVASPLTPKYVALNGPEWPFYTNFLTSSSSRFTYTDMVSIDKWSYELELEVCIIDFFIYIYGL